MQWEAAPSGCRGRQQAYSGKEDQELIRGINSPTNAIQACLTIKVLLGLPLRQMTGFVSSLLELSGLGWSVPDFSTLSRRQKTLDVTIPFRGSKGALHLLVDNEASTAIDGVDGPANGIALCQGGSCDAFHRAEPSMEQPITIGLDPLTGRRMRSNRREVGQERIPSSRRRCGRAGHCSPPVASFAGARVLRAARAVHGRDGGLFGRTSLGAGTGRARPRGAADAAGLCEAVCKAGEDGRGRRGSDLRGRSPALHARRAGEVGRPAGSTPGS